ncbi:MAG: hypothetical protein V7L25_02140 [Nostoc sp.]
MSSTALAEAKRLPGKEQEHNDDKELLRIVKIAQKKAETKNI